MICIFVSAKTKHFDKSSLVIFVILKILVILKIFHIKSNKLTTSLVLDALEPTVDIISVFPLIDLRKQLFLPLINILFNVVLFSIILLP